MKETRLEITSINSELKEIYKIYCMTNKSTMTENLKSYINDSLKNKEISKKTVFKSKTKENFTRLEITKINESIKTKYKILCVTNKTTMKADLTSFILKTLLENNLIDEKQVEKEN